MHRSARSVRTGCRVLPHSGAPARAAITRRSLPTTARFAAHITTDAERVPCGAFTSLYTPPKATGDHSTPAAPAARAAASTL